MTASVVIADGVIVPNTCVPVNVWPASVRATVALVDGKVIVVESVPVKVSVLLTVRDFPLAMEIPAPNASVDESVAVIVTVLLHVNVFPSAIVSVALDAGAVTATLLMLVAVATPSTGVTRVGEVARTPEPVPVVVIASSAVAPELTAMIFEPFPESVG